MSMVFRMRMIGGEDDLFLRDYELPYDMSLLEFDSFVCTDLEYDPMSMSSFFRSNERWEQEQEFTLMDMGDEIGGGPIAMEKAVLGQILRQNRDRLIWVFDPLGDRALFLELTGTVKADPSVKYPRIIRKEGIPPAQFSADMDGVSGDSIFDEAMDGFFSFEGDDFYDDDF